MIPATRFVELDKSVHDRKSFDCGTEELNQFLQLYAARHRSAGISMTMVLPEKSNKSAICAYYTLSHTEIERSTLPKKFAKRLPHYPVPVILIAQLAVDQQCHGKGLGKVTLIRAFKQAYAINEHLPSFAVVVDALDDDVQGFYEQYGFEVLETDNHRKRLFLSMNTIAKLLAG